MISEPAGASTERSLELAQRVLELVQGTRPDGASWEAEVAVEQQSTALTRFANSFIHQNVADDTTTVRLRVHTAGRTVTASTTVTTADGLRDLVERTTAAVGHAPADPRWPGLAPPAPPVGQAGYDESTAAATPAERAARVQAFVAAAGGLTTAGYCRTGLWTGSYANTAGQAVTGRCTEASMDGIARHAGADGMARAGSARLSDLDGSLLGARAAAKARAGADPVELPPGRYEVVLEPPAVSDLLEQLAIWGFNGKALAERRTFVSLGAEQFDPAVTLVDDPFAGLTPGRPFDGEGTPKRPLVLVDAGVSAAVAHDRRTAALTGGGAASTGHAVAAGSAWGAVAANLGMLPGSSAADQATGQATDRAEPGDPVDGGAAGLVGRVARGLLVTHLWYTRVLDPKTLVVTGLTRNGVWLIEDGKLTTPVRNLRFTQSYPQSLAPGAVKGIGPAATVLPAGMGTGWLRSPSLHLASWNFTGGASG